MYVFLYNALAHFTDHSSVSMTFTSTGNQKFPSGFIIILTLSRWFRMQPTLPLGHACAKSSHMCALR